MRKYLIVAAAGLLVAANASASGSNMASDLAADENIRPGEYAVAFVDGKPVGNFTVGADGSYRDAPLNITPVEGKFAYNDGKICLVPTGPKAAACWIVSDRSSDGSFIATNDKGMRVTVKPKAR